jgi:hypothetical protein
MIGGLKIKLQVSCCFTYKYDPIKMYMKTVGDLCGRWTLCKFERVPHCSFTSFTLKGAMFHLSVGISENEVLKYC